MTAYDNIVKLFRQLVPTGRAWKVPVDSYMESAAKGLALSESRAYADSISTLDSLLPDTDRFTAQDATDWERRLGLVTNPLTPLADRKLAIRRKMAAPGTNPAKGHYLYIQQQLQAAGFNVYVHENLFPLYPTGWESKDPIYVLPQTGFAQLADDQLNDFQLGSAQTYYGQYLIEAQLGNFQMSDLQLNESTWYHKVANSILKSEDATFNLGGSFRHTFFIGGQTLGTFANVSTTRETEFRQLILTLKQTQTIALLFINYT